MPVEILILNVCWGSSVLYMFCIYVWMFIYIYIYIYMCVCVYVCMFIYIYIYVCVCMFIYVYIYINMCVYVFMFICIYVCVCVCTCIYMFVYICMYMRLRVIQQIIWILLKELAAFFTEAPFSRKSIVMDPFMSQMTVSMTFFSDHYTWNVFL